MGMPTRDTSGLIVGSMLIGTLGLGGCLLSIKERNGIVQEHNSPAMDLGSDNFDTQPHRGKYQHKESGCRWRWPLLS